MLESLELAKQWLASNQPHLADAFAPPADAKAVADVEDALGITLPDSYKRFLTHHNGMTEGTPFVEWCTLLRVEDIPIVHAQLMELLDDDDGDDSDDSDDSDEDAEVDDEVRPVYLSKRWFPIGKSPRGRDYLCLDYDPTERGEVGQIVLFVSDDDDRECVASDFSGLMRAFVQGLTSGDIDFEGD